VFDALEIQPQAKILSIIASFKYETTISSLCSSQKCNFLYNYLPVVHKKATWYMPVIDPGEMEDGSPSAICTPPALAAVRAR
jgi:hypothetical protein